LVKGWGKLSGDGTGFGIASITRWRSYDSYPSRKDGRDQQNFWLANGLSLARHVERSQHVCDAAVKMKGIAIARLPFREK